MYNKPSQSRTRPQSFTDEQKVQDNSRQEDTNCDTLTEALRCLTGGCREAAVTVRGRGDRGGRSNSTLYATRGGHFFPKPSGGDMSRSILYISRYVMRPLPGGKMIGDHGRRNGDFPVEEVLGLKKAWGSYIIRKWQNPKERMGGEKRGKHRNPY